MDISATKLQTYMTCPRLYAFTYVNDWEPTHEPEALCFGRAWHRGLACLYRFRQEHRCEGYPDDAIAMAIESMLDGLPSFEGKRSRENAVQALVSYAKTHADKFDVLHVEVPGHVHLDMLGEHSLVFVLDAVCRTPSGKLFVMEHKTSSIGTVPAWRDAMQTSFQIGGYAHAGMCMCEDGEFSGVMVDVTTLRQNGAVHDRFTVHLSEMQLSMWLSDAHAWTERLLHEKPDDNAVVLSAFPRNPEACYRFGSLCPFFAFCTAWPNPLARRETVPLGFKRREHHEQ